MSKVNKKELKKLIERSFRRINFSMAIEQSGLDETTVKKLVDKELDRRLSLLKKKVS